MEKFHYIEFWVSSYTRDGCPLKNFFLTTSALETKTFFGFFNLIKGAHNGSDVGLPGCLSFFGKIPLHRILGD